MRRLFNRALLPASCVLVALALGAALVLPGPALGQLSRPSANPTFGSLVVTPGDIQIDSSRFLYLNGSTHTIAVQSSGTALNLYGAPVTINNNLSAVISVTSPTYSATAASGANGFACTTNGCRVDTGSGSNDYFYSDGTNINTPAALNFAGGTISADVALSSFAGTAGSGTGIAVQASGYLRPFVHSINVTFSALTAAATTQDVTIWTVPAKTRLTRVVAQVTAAFDDGAGPISAVVLRCGPAVNSQAYLLDGSVFATGTLGDAAAEIGANLLSATVADIPSMSATTAISCRYTSTGGNLSTLTTGSTTFWIEGVVYP